MVLSSSVCYIVLWIYWSELFFLMHWKSSCKAFTVSLTQDRSHGTELPVYLLLRTRRFDATFSLCASPCARFRVVARSLSTFLLVQIPAEGQVRLRAGSEPKLSQKAQQVTCAGFLTGPLCVRARFVGWSSQASLQALLQAKSSLNTLVLFNV